MARRGKPEPRPADWPPDRTLRVLRQQLENLQRLKGRRYDEATQEEEEWEQTTRAAFIRGFGEGSHNVSNFNWARTAGVQTLHGISAQQRQSNFEQRIAKYETALRSSLNELQLSVPQQEIEGAYAAGNEFAFYLDLKGILAVAAKEVFVIDNYLNTEFFELYVQPIPPGVIVRILTDEVRGNLQAVATKYAGRGGFELRSSKEVHDRHVFVDGGGWIIGQSIKEAAHKKPTYMVEVATAMIPAMQSIYEAIWARAATVVKG